MTVTRRIEKLQPMHRVEDFDCGQADLNRYLTRFAWINQQSNAALTYVGLSGDTILGYYSLAVGEAVRDETPDRVKKGLARHPVPIMLLVRLAVDLRWQGQGAGRSLLVDALQRTLQAADIAGIRALVVHAKDDAARRYYEQFDFVPSPSDPLHLFLLIKDVRKMLTES